MPIRHPQVYGSSWDVRLMRELAKNLATPFSTICQQSWLKGEVPADWELANVVSFCNRGQKDDPGPGRN